MQANKEEVKFVKVIANTIEKDHSFPMAFAFYIELDKVPSTIWQQIFFEEWKDSLFLLKRRVTIEGNKIRVVFAEGEEIEQANFYKKLIEKVNQRTASYLEMATWQEKQKEKERQSEQLTIDKIKERLKSLEKV